jgi:hypothetical protein
MAKEKGKKYHAEIVSDEKAVWKSRKAFATLQEAVAAVVLQAEKYIDGKPPYTRHWVTEQREHMIDFGSHSRFGRITCDDPGADLALDGAEQEKSQPKPDPLRPEPIPMPDEAQMTLVLRPCPEVGEEGRYPFAVSVPGKGVPDFVVRAKTGESAKEVLADILYHALDKYEGDGDVTADD